MTSEAASLARSEDSALAGHPRLGPLDILVQLWRAKWLMVLVFLPLFALGVLAALSLNESYTASSRLYVQLGDENVFRPVLGNEGAGAFLEQEQVVQGEIELLRSPVIAERVLREIGLERVHPELAEAAERTAASGRAESGTDPFEEAFRLGVVALQRNFAVGSEPKRPTVNTFFEHEDPVMAAEVLNAFIATYLQYRRDVFTSGGEDTSLGDQRVQFQDALREAEADIRAFKARNGISDFETERETARALYASTSEALQQAEGRVQAARGQLAGVEAAFASTPAAIDLFTEDNTDQRLTDLKLERQSLINRDYKPSSQTVRAVDREIAELQRFLATDRPPPGTVRRGPNPVHQELASTRAAASAEAAAARGQRDALSRQLRDAEARLERLSQLEPDWLQLQRRKGLLESNLNTFSAREIEARSRDQLARDRNARNILVLERATPPVQGSSLRLPVLALAFLIAAFTALVAGLLRAMTRPGLPTARSVERTLGVPVLAAAGR